MSSIDNAKDYKRKADLFKDNCYICRKIYFYIQASPELNLTLFNPTINARKVQCNHALREHTLQGRV